MIGQPAPSEEKPKQQFQNEVLPATPEEWACFICPEEARQTFRTNSSPHCINTCSINKQARLHILLSLRCTQPLPRVRHLAWSSYQLSRDCIRWPWPRVKHSAAAGNIDWTNWLWCWQAMLVSREGAPIDLCGSNQNVGRKLKSDYSQLNTCCDSFM